jgi:hypothetical protein
MAKELILLKIVMPYTILVFLSIAITVEIYEIYLERKDVDSIVGLMISFMIRCIVAIVLSYYAYLEILNG